jgi:hypothetical protein
MPAPERACASCGEVHSVSDLELTFFRPEAIIALPPEVRATQAKESNDLCQIGDDRFFVRSLLPFFVDGWEDPYAIGVWAEVTRQDFDRILELWSEDSQRDEPPMNARLANRIPHLPDTLDLPVLLQLMDPETRPLLEVLDTSHPLHAEQHDGITPHRASQYTNSVRAEG